MRELYQLPQICKQEFPIIVFFNSQDQYRKHCMPELIYRKHRRGSTLKKKKK